jgi:hypothetical protein
VIVLSAHGQGELWPASEYASFGDCMKSGYADCEDGSLIATLVVSVKFRHQALSANVVVLVTLYWSMGGNPVLVSNDIEDFHS